MNKLLQQICKLQEINSGQKIVCPYCEQRKVTIIDNKWYCSCGKHGDLMELLRLVEEDYLARHRLYFYNQKQNQGVGY